MKIGVNWENGRSDSYLVLGNTVYSLVVITTCLKAGIEMDAWTWFSHGSIWGSIALWFLFLTIYSYVWPTLPIAANMTGMMYLLISSPVFWFTLLLVPVVTLLYDVCYKAYRTTVLTSETDRIRIAEIKKQEVSNYVDGRVFTTESSSLLDNMKNTFSRSKKRQKDRDDLEMNARRGYAFSQEEGGAISQTDYIRSYDTTARYVQQCAPRTHSTHITQITDQFAKGLGEHNPDFI